MRSLYKRVGSTYCLSALALIYVASTLDSLRSTVLCAKNAKYSSVAFSSTSEYAEPNKAIKTLTRIMVARKFHE